MTNNLVLSNQDVKGWSSQWRWISVVATIRRPLNGSYNGAWYNVRATREACPLSYLRNERALNGTPKKGISQAFHGAKRRRQ
jgi:hypothetical protein